MTHRSGRGTKMYIEDNSEMTIHAIDCVPVNRSKNAWTNGVAAYRRKTPSTSSDQLVGWFYPPRLRNKNHHGRSAPRKIVDRIAHFEEE